MKAYRINKLFFPTLFASVSALSGTFKDLNPDYLVKYFNSNIQAKCPMSPVQILDIFKNPNISQTQSDCFVLDRTNVSDIKYVMKPVGGCSPDALHPKLLSISTSMCPVAPAASAAAPAPKGSSMSATETVATLAPVAVAAASIADIRNKSAASAERAQARREGGGAAPAAGAAVNVPGSNTSSAVNTAVKTANGAAAAPTTPKVDADGWTHTANGMRIKTGDGDVAHATITPKGYKEELIEADLPEGGKVTTPVYSAPDGSPITFEEYQKGVTAEFQTPSQELAKGLPAGTQEAGMAVANASPKPSLDEKGAADLAAAEAADKEFTTMMTTQISEGITEATTILNVEISECNLLMTGAIPCAAAAKAKITPAITALQKLQTTISTYVPAKTSCSGSAARADNFCSMIRSPTAQAVGMLMSVGGAALSKMSSASQTCGTTSDLSQLAQTGMTLANVACTGMKFMCDSSCASAQKILTGMVAEAKIAITGAPASTAKIQAALTKEQSAPTGVAPKIAQCKKHAADIVQFTTQILGLATAAAQAKDCKEKLTAGGGTGSGTVTMDEMCKDPTQAQTLVCKCKVDATAAGCPGAVVKTTNKDGGPLVIKGNGSGSQLAGIDAFRQGSGLSSAAKTALGLDSNSAASTAGSALNSNFGDSGVAAATSGAATDARGSLSASGSDDKNKSDLAKDKKFSFGSFGSLGSAIGGFFGGSGSKKSGTSGNFGTEKQIAAAKRQIANEQLRSEISTASGRSNWDKVRTRYLESNSTFIGD